MRSTALKMQRGFFLCKNHSDVLTIFLHGTRRKCDHILSLNLSSSRGTRCRYSYCFNLLKRTWCGFLKCWWLYIGPTRGYRMTYYLVVEWNNLICGNNTQYSTRDWPIKLPTLMQHVKVKLLHNLLHELFFFLCTIIFIKCIAWSLIYWIMVIH